MFKHYWDRVPNWLKNRYVLTLLGFVIWMVLFDQNDVITQVKLRSQLNDLRERRAYLTTEIETARASLEELLGNDVELEKFAREKYLMKKDDEVIFVLVEEEGED